MKPTISKNVSTFKCTKSPVREIMDLANPQFFKKAGLDPAEVISFSGGWVNHEAPPARDQLVIHRSLSEFYTLGPLTTDPATAGRPGATTPWPAQD